jgi:hypothetical protein
MRKVIEQGRLPSGLPFYLRSACRAQSTPVLRTHALLSRIRCAPLQCADFDIPLQYTGCRATKVSGHITGVPGDSNTRYKVQFLATNSAGGSIAAPIAMNSNAVYKSGDTFTDSVCQGEYDLVLSDDKPIQTWSEFPSHKVVFILSTCR